MFEERKHHYRCNAAYVCGAAASCGSESAVTGSAPCAVNSKCATYYLVQHSTAEVEGFTGACHILGAFFPKVAGIMDTFSGILRHHGCVFIQFSGITGPVLDANVQSIEHRS